jgi:hypothetical protein
MSVYAHVSLSCVRSTGAVWQDQRPRHECPTCIRTFALVEDLREHHYNPCDPAERHCVLLKAKLATDAEEVALVSQLVERNAAILAEEARKREEEEAAAAAAAATAAAGGTDGGSSDARNRAEDEELAAALEDDDGDGVEDFEDGDAD